MNISGTPLRNENGTTYVVRYRNEWNKTKKRSEPKERIYVGSLNLNSGKVSLSKNFVEKFSEFESKTYFYENHCLIEHSPEQAQELIEERSGSELDDIISPIGSWICWQTAVEHGILKDLKTVMDSTETENFLKLAIYVFLTENGALQLYQQWLPQQWFPKAHVLDSGKQLPFFQKSPMRLPDNTSA